MHRGDGDGHVSEELLCWLDNNRKLLCFQASSAPCLELRLNNFEVAAARNLVQDM